IIGPAIVEASLAHGSLQPRAGNRAAGASPRGVFPCAGTDSWVAITCRTDEDWRSLAAVLGDKALADDPRFATLAGRHAHEDELERRVADATRRFDRRRLVTDLRARGVPAAPVNSSQDVLADPDLAARGFWQHLEHPVIGEVSVPRPPMRFASGAPRDLVRPPLLGEHTREVAHELLGLEDGEIDRLVADGVLA
ncbi:MAG TPA: CoA transferase, partial [Candidatus Limnocylindrales bacterium]